MFGLRSIRSPVSASNYFQFCHSSLKVGLKPAISIRTIVIDSKSNSPWRFNSRHLKGTPNGCFSSSPLKSHFRSITTESSQSSSTTAKKAKAKVPIFTRISRASTFLLSSALVLGASGIAILVIYLVFSELFLPSGDTRTFNKAVKLVEKDEIAQQLLNFQPGERLKAYGETADNKWTRNRPVASVRTLGKDGKDHLLMQFHVESDSAQHGTVILEQIDNSFFESKFAYIALDVPGNKRHFIIEPRLQNRIIPSPLSGSGGFLGVKWGPKKDE